MKKGIVYKKDQFAGVLWEDEEGYHFRYNQSYIDNPIYGAISKTLPIRKESYDSESMIPFFDGLIPEGWLLKIAVDNWKLNPGDRMNLVLTLCEDNIGDVSIKRES